MAEMTAADHNIICELKLSASPDQFELLRRVLELIEQQAATIDKKNAEINTLTQANAEMVLRLTIYAMRNLTSEQIDDVCQRIIAGQVKEGQ